MLIRDLVRRNPEDSRSLYGFLQRSSDQRQNARSAIRRRAHDRYLSLNELGHEPKTPAMSESPSLLQ